MPSATRFRLTFALSAVVASVLVATIGMNDADRAVDVELTRAPITEGPIDGVIPASASRTAPSATAPTTTAPPTTAAPTTTAAPATTSAPAPAPAPPPAPAPEPAPAPTAPPTTSAPAPAPAPTSTTSSTRNAGCESSMMQWMNEARSANGIHSLTYDGNIHSIALRWTDTMAQRQDLAHNPDYANQIFDARPEAMTVAENVGRGTGSDRSLFDAFMASSGHRSKILGGQFSHATVACTVDAGGQTWTTMNFWG